MKCVWLLVGERIRFGLYHSCWNRESVGPVHVIGLR